MLLFKGKMKLLLFSLFAITQAFLAKALETDLQFKCKYESCINNEEYK